MSQQTKSEKAWCVVGPDGLFFDLVATTEEYAWNKFVRGCPNYSGSHEKTIADHKAAGYRCIRVTITPDTGDEG